MNRDAWGKENNVALESWGGGQGTFPVGFMLEFEKLGNEVGVVYAKVEATISVYVVWYCWKEAHTLTDR